MQAGKTAKLPKLPFISNDYEFDIRMPPPDLGAHTREVLSEAGLSEAEIDALFASKVAGPRPAE
jgi:crotonobetainyl-CoA:carnitine CoA-transferase CaiB-like acyl-CoA transferase